MQGRGRLKRPDGTEVEFDSFDPETNTLIDVKGDYGQFLDPATGDWQHWWTGWDAEVDAARRQVEAAPPGTKIEWGVADRALFDSATKAQIDGVFPKEIELKWISWR